MAKNLYNLTAVTTVNDSDLLHVNQGSVSSDKKVTKQNLLKEVNSSITSLNNSLTQCSSVANGTLTLHSSQSSATNNITIKQNNHVVCVWGFLAGITTSSSGTTIGTVSGVSLPTNNVRFLCSVGSNAYSTGTPTYAVLGTNGSLELGATADGSGRAVYFDIAYIV